MRDQEILQDQYDIVMEAASELKRKGSQAMSIAKLVEGRDILERLIKMAGRKKQPKRQYKPSKVSM